MKKIFGSLLVLSALLLNSCGKNDTGCQPVPVADEKTKMLAFCTANNITPTQHPSGLIYEIINPGTGATPTTASTVSVVYTGYHFDNTVFDAAANPYTSLLGNFIDGWKIGLQLIKKGGQIKLVIPSALAYSCTGSQNQNTGVYIINRNEPLYFVVTLSDVR